MKIVSVTILLSYHIHLIKIIINLKYKPEQCDSGRILFYFFGFWGFLYLFVKPNSHRK